MKKILLLSFFFTIPCYGAFTTDRLTATSTFTVTQATISFNSTTYYWMAGRGTSGQVLTTDGAANPILTWQTPTGGSGSTIIRVGTGTATAFTTQVTSPTLAISFLGSQFHSVANGTTNFITLFALPLGDTNYIWNTNSLQSGATYFVSSGTVNGQFIINSIPATGGFAEDTEMRFTLSNNSLGGSNFVQIKNKTNTQPRDLSVKNIGSDGQIYALWSMGTNSAQTVLKAADSSDSGAQENIYLLSGGGTNQGSTIIQSSGTGVLNLGSHGVLGVIGRTSFGQRVLGVFSSDGSLLTLLYEVNASSIATYVPFEVKGSTVVRFYDQDNSNYVAVRSSFSLVHNMEYVLPNTTGTVNQVLSIASLEGSTTTLKWATASTGDGPPLYVSSVVAMAPLSAATAGTTAGSTVTLTVDASSFTLFGGNVIKLQNTLQDGATFFVSSGTVKTLRIDVGGSITWPDGTVQISSPIASSGGGGFTSSYVSSINVTGTGIAISTNGTVGSTVTFQLVQGNTNYIQNTNSIQQFATYYVSSGTVSTFTVTNQASFLGMSSFTIQNVTLWEFGTSTDAVTVTFSTNSTLNIPSGQSLTNASSVTVQGVITAGANITLTPTAGVLTIAASGASAAKLSTITWRGEEMHITGSSKPYISFSTGEAYGSVYYDDTSTQAATVQGFLNNYAGGTLFADIVFTSTATTGTVNWGVYIECKTPTFNGVPGDALSADTDSFGAINSTSTTVGATAGMFLRATATLTNGDSCSAGDPFRLLITREAGTADSASGFGRPRLIQLYE